MFKSILMTVKHAETNSLFCGSFSYNCVIYTGHFKHNELYCNVSKVYAYVIEAMFF